jgi:threonine dehydratase
MSETTLDDVHRAHARIVDWIHRTPILTSRRLNRLLGAELFFKCENFQKTGAFKARGALNAVLSLTEEEASHGVATHSSGNHAAALSWAAGLREITSTVVMPRTASRIKVAAVEGYGGRIIYCEPTHKAREEAAARIVRETGAQMVHPYNDPRIIAGQATAAVELLDEVPELDAVLCPVGGGGLLAGTAIVAKAHRPGIKVFAGEPEGAADASQSLLSGVRTPVANPASIADGLLAFVGNLTFPVMQRHVEAIATVSEAEIAAAVRVLMETLKIAVEPSGAVGYAAAAGGKLGIKGLKVGIILSGGNVDFDRSPWTKPT